MKKFIKTSLCKGLRACGIPKELALNVLDVITKWYDSNGAEWTMSRIKALRQWYETSLSGHPIPPVWFRHTSQNMPTGVWGAVFKLPTAKALGVLSCGTVFQERELSASQKEKFLHGIAGSGTQNRSDLRALMVLAGKPAWYPKVPEKMPDIPLPTLFDMNGSIPVHEGRERMRPEQQLGEALKGLEESWEEVPQVTFDFLYSQGLEGYMPYGVLGNEYGLELNRPHSSIVGAISVIQEPELKARVVANPNRVLQVTLDPLKQVVMDLVHQLPTQCVFDQQSGMQWTKDQLMSGITLAGSDLTSASDLLDLDLCLELIDFEFGFSRIQGYTDFVQYYRAVCRSDWYSDDLGVVSWKQGSSLGTGPSIGILSLANDAAARISLRINRSIGEDLPPNPRDTHRVLGDDIVMRSELQPQYEEVIAALGGEINHQKTLTSDKVAEFAGRVITRNAIFMKRIKYKDPSDDSFMEYCQQLGDQAKHFLKPRQRRVYQFFKRVPGVMVDGPWMKDSFGVPFSKRYQWYLDEVLPAFARLEPDVPKEQYVDTLFRACLAATPKVKLEEHQRAFQSVVDRADAFAMPFLEEGYLPSDVTPTFRLGGDPRRTNGASTLQTLETVMKGPQDGDVGVSPKELRSLAKLHRKPFKKLIAKEVVPPQMWSEAQRTIPRSFEEWEERVSEPQTSAPSVSSDSRTSLLPDSSETIADILASDSFGFEETPVNNREDEDLLDLIDGMERD